MECDIASYHVESFNYLIDPGVRLAALDVPPVKFRFSNGDNVIISYTSASMQKPLLKAKGSDSVPVYPSEARQRGLTYSGSLKVGIKITVNGLDLQEINVEAGQVPIMLRSNLCHLANMTEKQLVKHNEEPQETGGYFICKGSEKVIRLLIANRSNFPYAIKRDAYKKRGKFFSEFGVMMRSVREMHSVAMNTLHYLTVSTMIISIQYRREIFYIPLMYILRALVDMNEFQIYEKMVQGRNSDGVFSSCVRNMIRNARKEKVHDRESAMKILGARFRVCVGDLIAPWETDEEVTQFIFKYCLLIHLDSDMDKFYCLVYMAQKLMSHVKGEILEESPDNPQFQEANVSGHIMLAIIRERLQNQLQNAKTNLVFMERKQGEKFQFTEQRFLQAWGTQKNAEITRGLEYFLATGTLVTKTGLGLMQATGFSIIAERINQLRFVSHFRAVHRGAFFMEMRTTEARKLRPEAWGFICPVHTPDGAPCGLLNHVTASTRIVNTYETRAFKLHRTLADLGVIPHGIDDVTVDDDRYCVLVDGNFIGYISKKRAPFVLQHLRKMKVADSDTRIPNTAELTLIKYSSDPENVLTQYPGLYIFTTPGRFVRPVKNLYHDVTEYIGTFEQVYLSIIIDPEEAEPGVTMHQELHPSALFSFAGNLIPFPDHNQSPRNVYQCQMGKQTMGIPIHSWHARNDNKMYRLQFPQRPLLKPEAYDLYKMDDYPLGTNACVAVISYTGYDMEDAMVINKSSFERGFGHGTVIKVEVVDLNENNRYANADNANVFERDPCDENMKNFVDADGLPYPGKRYEEDDIYYCYKAGDTQTYNISKFHYAEPAVCGFVRIVEASENLGKTKALIQWRIQRNPVIGDKFASRHGQKGINSFLWPQESLPFSENGMVPDIIFNPHGFPSRMTIGMMIESMAGKGAAMHGQYFDASPFVFSEKNTAIDYFGDLLQKAGYNYFGEETLYSGVDGREMKVQVFFGVVYYQRLRHMILDKFQVRGTGPIDPTTNQPVKGRKKGGGIRFGEMERDSLIAHGTAFCLQDRLLLSSDVDDAAVCGKCGSLISIKKMALNKTHRKRENNCVVCSTSEYIQKVQIPHVLLYLAAELASMNIKIKLNLRDPMNVKSSLQSLLRES